MPSFVPVHPPRNPEECPSWLYEAIQRLNRVSSISIEGLSAVVRGESPDGSGIPLVDTSKFFYKPGLSGGQLAYGGTGSGEDLTLSSTAAATKGSILLGSAGASAYDESGDFLGIGTATPAVKLHLNTSALGTAVIGATGTPFLRVSIAGTTLGDLVPYVFDGTTTDVAVKPYSTAGGLQVIPVDGTSGIRLSATQSRGRIQAGRKDSSNLVQESALTIGGQGSTVLKQFSVESQFISLNVTGATGQNGASMTANTARVGVNVDPFAYSSTAAASAPGSLHLAPLGGSLVTDPAPLIIERPVTAAWPLIELRRASTGTSPTKAVGALQWQIDGLGSIRWYDGGTRRLRIRSLGDSGSETGNSGIQVLNAADRLQFETIPETAVWADSAVSLTIRAANTSTEGNRLALCSQSSAALSRLGICATSTVLGPASVGVLPAPLSSRILTVVNAAGTVLSGFDSAGAYFLVSGGGAGKLLLSDANGVGSWSTRVAAGVAGLADSNVFTQENEFSLALILAGQSMSPTVPSAPAAGKAKVFADSGLNEAFPAYRTPNGRERRIQGHEGWIGHSLLLPDTGTAMTRINFPVSTTGTVTTPGLLTGALISSAKRTQVASTTVAGNVASIRSSSTMCWRGNATGLGGFYYVCRFAVDPSTLTDTRLFVGLAAASGTIGGSDPSSQVNIIGVGLDAADTNFQVMYNDAAGTATKVDLGANYQRNSSQVYQVEFYCAPNGSTVYYRVQRLDDRSISPTTGNFNTDIPASTVFLYAHADAGVGATGGDFVLLHHLRTYIGCDV